MTDSGPLDAEEVRAVETAAPADPPSTAPCSAEEARQLDFWIGEWDCEWDGGRCSNRVEAALGGCVILESFEGRPGLDLQGMSMSLYDVTIGKWRQTWADSWGNWFDLVGEFRDGRMELYADEPRHRGARLRMLFDDIEHDRFRWTWSRSHDDGITWDLLWELRYTRR